MRIVFQTRTQTGDGLVAVAINPRPELGDSLEASDKVCVGHNKQEQEGLGLILNTQPQPTLSKIPGFAVKAVWREPIFPCGWQFEKPLLESVCRVNSF